MSDENNVALIFREGNSRARRKSAGKRGQKATFGIFPETFSRAPEAGGQIEPWRR